MSKYLKLFNNHVDYETFINGTDVALPNVSYCIDANDVHYNPITFFIYHTSDCTVEKHVAKRGTPFDQLSLVRNGYFYGGTTTIYGGEGDICAQIRNGDYSAFETTNTVTDINSASYDGSSLTTDVSGSSKRFFAKANYIKTNLVPEDGQIYFIKEVPRDSYMKQYISFIYDTNTNIISSIEVHLFNIDDNNYDLHPTINIIKTDGNIEYAGSVVSKYSNYGSTELFGVRGYLCVKLNINRDVLPSYNSSFIIENTLTTLDGVDIHSYTKIYTNDWTMSNISAERSDTMPSLD